MTILDEVLICIDDLQPIDKERVFSLFPSTPKAVIASALARLEHRKNIALNELSGKYEPTQQGSERIVETLEELENIRSDRIFSWYLCIFAIPEKSKVVREKLRLVLRQFGFGKLRGGLFLAHRATVSPIEKMIAQENLQRFVNLIKIDNLPLTYLEQHASYAWPWKELESEYYALIVDTEDLLANARSSQLDNIRIMAKVLVYRLAQLIKKDPQLDTLTSIITVNIPRDRMRKLYFALKPYCYSA